MTREAKIGMLTGLGVLVMMGGLVREGVAAVPAGTVTSEATLGEKGVPMIDLTPPADPRGGVQTAGYQQAGAKPAGTITFEEHPIGESDAGAQKGQAYVIVAGDNL